MNKELPEEPRSEAELKAERADVLLSISLIGAFVVGVVVTIMSGVAHNKTGFYAGVAIVVTSGLIASIALTRMVNRD